MMIGLLRWSFVDAFVDALLEANKNGVFSILTAPPPHVQDERPQSNLCTERYRNRTPGMMGEYFFAST